MKSILLLLIGFTALALMSWKFPDNRWKVAKYKNYSLYYTSPDNQNKEAYSTLINNGLGSVKSFFNSPYRETFDVYVHANRHSLDSTWQKDWGMLDFKSECWMVASGVAKKFDMISPARWDSEACEHVYAQTIKTQQLITHELVHVFHGQRNGSPDFSTVEGLDWFVEGLATYASGQCDSLRIAEVKKAIAENMIPKGLDGFWSGKLKYGLSGSLVMFIDKRYGRAKLMELLPFTKREQVLASLNITEAALLDQWKGYIDSL